MPQQNRPPKIKEYKDFGGGNPVIHGQYRDLFWRAS